MWDVGWGMWNVECGMGDGECGMGNGGYGMGNVRWWMFLLNLYFVYKNHKNALPEFCQGVFIVTVY